MGALQNFMVGGGGLKSIHEKSMGELKMLSKNTCERVHLIVKLLAISGFDGRTFRKKL